MTEIAYTAVLVIAMLASAAAGLWLRQHLGERHLTRDGIESIRLLMGMLLTFAALVLGLLTSNAKQRFDGLSDDLSRYSADLIQLDSRLRAYGPAADPMRGELRAYTAAAVADTWPAEPVPRGDYPHFTAGDQANGIEGRGLGALLNRIEIEIDGLAPGDELHRNVAAALREQIGASLAERWRLIFAARSTIAWPFLLTLTSWLCIIFAIFGMTSPPGRVVYVAVVLSALSIASPLYLIFDYSDALTGNIALSSHSLRTALAHMDLPSESTKGGAP